MAWQINDIQHPINVVKKRISVVYFECSIEVCQIVESLDKFGQSPFENWSFLFIHLNFVCCTPATKFY